MARFVCCSCEHIDDYENFKTGNQTTEAEYDDDGDMIALEDVDELACPECGADNPMEL